MRTDLASGLVLVERILSFLNSSSLGLPLHIILDTDNSVDLGFDRECTGLGELSRTTRGLGGLIISIVSLSVREDIQQQSQRPMGSDCRSDR
jgi:hypothetical protein